jgi:hypothetical protein
MKNYAYGTLALTVGAAIAAAAWLTRWLLKEPLVWGDMYESSWQNDLDDD